MKIKFLLITLLSAFFGFSQEELPEALKTDSTWFKEVIKFPIGFAPEIPYQGFEDLRFAPGFTNADSPESWCYVWAWSLHNIASLSAKELERDVQYYFDGLLGLKVKENKVEHHTTNALFIKKESKGGRSIYIGKVNTFDTRYTKKPLTLNVIVENNYCEKTNEAIVVFRFSPQNFDHEVWKKLLEDVTLMDGICN